MRLSKSTAHVLLHILNGATTTAKISQQIPSIDVRSVQRALQRLVELGLVERHGTSNNPTYDICYSNLLNADIAAKMLEDEVRPSSSFNHHLLDWLESLQSSELAQYVGPSNALPDKPTTMSAKDLEYLTVELSWKSSALEGNTYTLLDTQLLLLEGVKAKNRTEFETQMILNHKNAISFIVEHKDLFARAIELSTVEHLHSIIGYNLGIEPGIRKKPVRIGASNYLPLDNPHQLREIMDCILALISHTADPFVRALLALALVPYVQAFEDGNKRTGRMLANAILIACSGRGFSLRKTDARQLALAYLAFYEFNSLQGLSKILRAELY